MTWRDQALCRKYPHLQWVPANAKAKAKVQRTVCARCPVSEECLEAALHEEASVKFPLRFGIRGGTNGKERLALWKARTGRRRATDAETEHGTHARYQRHRRDKELPCAPCAAARASYEARRRLGPA